MISTLRSAAIWSAVCVLILLWLPLLVVTRIFDRDKVRYRTGRMFRRLGVALTKVNPFWHLHLSGFAIPEVRRPYIVVSNHQSMADIPLISHLPWEMKWVAKRELFALPVVGWMMRLAGDIPLARGDARSGARMLLHAARVLQLRCPVMFFPEGTRSPDGRVGRFTEGAFHLAAREQVPLLPIVVDGSFDCLPKDSWKFGHPAEIRVEVLPPVETTGLKPSDASVLRDRVRGMIIERLAMWRGVAPRELDATVSPDVSHGPPPGAPP
jgi:1-acyl-sn-glycerol-3-phosphate acyltransferase